MVKASNAVLTFPSPNSVSLKFDRSDSNLKLSLGNLFQRKEIRCIRVSHDLRIGQQTGRDVTVYHMIWYNECKQCIISYGFTERIEPVNNLI